MRARARMMFHVSLLVFCAPFVTKLTDVRRQNARRPSSRRRTSAILVGLYQNRNTLSKCRVIPNRREESQHRHMRFLVASLCRNDKMIVKLYFDTAHVFTKRVLFTLFLEKSFWNVCRIYFLFLPLHSLSESRHDMRKAWVESRGRKRKSSLKDFHRQRSSTRVRCRMNKYGKRG